MKRQAHAKSFIKRMGYADGGNVMPMSPMMPIPPMPPSPMTAPPGGAMAGQAAAPGAIPAGIPSGIPGGIPGATPPGMMKRGGGAVKGKA